MLWPNINLSVDNVISLSFGAARNALPKRSPERTTATPEQQTEVKQALPMSWQSQ